MDIEQPSTTATTIAGSKQVIINEIERFAGKNDIIISVQNSTFSKQLSGGHHQFDLTFDNDSKVISIMNKNKLVTKFRHTPAVNYDYHMNVHNKAYTKRMFNTTFLAPPSVKRTY